MAASTSEPVNPDARLYPARPFLAASIAVFRDGCVLLATRTKPPADRLFSLPGGVVEAGETLHDAALRELHEEVGVTARIIGFAGHTEIIERDEAGQVRRHFVVTCFAGEWTDGEPTTGPEAGEVRFVDPAEVRGLRTTPGLADMVVRAHAVFMASGMDRR